MVIGRKGVSAHLSEGGPLSLRALVHVVVGVGVGVEDPRGAQLVHGVQADPRRVPEAHSPVLVASGRQTGGLVTQHSTKRKTWRPDDGRGAGSM